MLNLQILRKIHSIVATLIMLYRNITALCHDKDWFSLLEIVGNYVVTYFLCCDIILLEAAESYVRTRSPLHTRPNLIGRSEPDLGEHDPYFHFQSKYKKKFNTNVNTFSIPNAFQILIGYK